MSNHNRSVGGRCKKDGAALHAGSSAAIWMGTLLTLIPACNRVKATSYRAEVDRYDADLEANHATNGRLVVTHK